LSDIFSFSIGDLEVEGESEDIEIFELIETELHDKSELIVESRRDVVELFEEVDLDRELLFEHLVDLFGFLVSFFLWLILREDVAEEDEAEDTECRLEEEVDDADSDDEADEAWLLELLRDELSRLDSVEEILELSSSSFVVGRLFFL
jgi:hypothetical protein